MSGCLVSSNWLDKQELRSDKEQFKAKYFSRNMLKTECLYTTSGSLYERHRWQSGCATFLWFWIAVPTNIVNNGNDSLKGNWNILKHKTRWNPIKIYYMFDIYFCELFYVSTISTHQIISIQDLNSKKSAASNHIIYSFQQRLKYSEATFNYINSDNEDGLRNRSTQRNMYNAIRNANFTSKFKWFLVNNQHSTSQCTQCLRICWARRKIFFYMCVFFGVFPPLMFTREKKPVLLFSESIAILCGISQQMSAFVLQKWRHFYVQMH